MRTLFALSLVLVLAVAGCGSTSDPESSSSTTKAPTGPELRIMALGDSITAADRVPGGYRTRLASLMTAEGNRFIYVGTQNDPNAPEVSRIHEGHNGFWVENLGDQSADWLSSQKPQVILLMAGTNDILNNEGQGAPDRLRTLINKLLVEAPGSSVVVSSVPPLIDHEGDVASYNQAVSGVVSALSSEGKPVSYIDGGSAFKDSDLADDGVHPQTQESYDAMASQWAPAVQSIFDTAKASQG